MDQLKITIDPITNSKSISDLELPIQYQNGAPVSIADANVYVFDGSDLIASGEIDVPSGFEKLSYSWSDSETAILAESPKSGYKANWQLNNGAINITRWFSVNYWVLNAPATEQDIISEKPDLDVYRPVYTAKASSASSGTLLEANDLMQNEDYWNGAVVQFMTGDNQDDKYRVSDWQYPNLILSESLEYTVQENDRFKLFRSFQYEINSAWDEITNRLTSWVPKITASGALNLAVDQYDFKSIHLYQSIAKIASSLRVKQSDTFDLLRQEYDQKVSTAWSELRVKIDNDLDGIYATNDTDGSDTVRGGQIWVRH